MSRAAVVWSVVALAALASAWGCSSDGSTPSTTTCPPLPLYDINDATARANARAALLAAKNCLTLPVGLEAGASGK